MSAMSKSYPFLWISKHHGVPYEVVLLGAQYLRADERTGMMNPHEKAASTYVKAMDQLDRINLMDDIDAANVEFARIQREGW